MSFRLAYTARRLRALAIGGIGHADDAMAALLADRERLADRPLDDGLDPLAADFERSLAEMALLGGDAAGAMTTLARLAKAEAEADARRPAQGWTLVWLGRGADRLGEARRATECHRSVVELAGAQGVGIDPCHPVILTARYDQAERCAAVGDTAEAGRQLEPVLDRTLLAHGYPAIGEAHPLLARARALAARLGLAVPGTVTADLDEVSLDIDV